MLKTEKECIDYIHSHGRFGKKAGLCNIKALLNILGNPHKDLKCVHIAGTNGKGSVSCMIANILSEKGYKVGMNTSPFIEVFNERLTINGQNIPADKLVHYTNVVSQAIEKLPDIHPIEFEIITAIGFLYFKEENCDFAVIECGIGGLMDSTNVIESPEVSVITNIGMDHTDILGSSMEEIAMQKAGIIKPEVSVVTHPDIPSEALDVISKIASEKNSPLITTNSDYKVVSSSLEETHVVADNLNIRLKLLGSFQSSNAALAVNVARTLGIDDNSIVRGIEKTRWKCRFELVCRSTIIDGAHNFQGVCAFRQSVEMYLADKKKVFVIGMLNDKDFDSCARELAKLEGTFIVTDVPSARQTDAKGVYEKIKKYVPDAMYEPSYKKAVDTARTLAGDEGFVCMAGSLYLAGAVRSYIHTGVIVS